MKSADLPRAGWVERWLSIPDSPSTAMPPAITTTGRSNCTSGTRRSAPVSGTISRIWEVGLRNAYDRVLIEHLSLPRHWTACGIQVFAPVLRTRKRGSRGKVSVDVNATPRASLEHALREAGGRNAPPGKVIAQLTFGFWRYLTSSAHEVTLWRPALHHAFPPGTRRSELDGRISRLHELRNRVAHHEPLLRLDVTKLHSDLLHVAGLLEPELEQHVRRHSEVIKVFEQRPDDE